jgi:3-deoxy-D-manno-octulosonic-acid transferase
MILIGYSILTRLLEPILILYIWLRQARGKEDAFRKIERFGISTKDRPRGNLFWFHAASVGEVISIWPLMLKMHKKYPTAHILITTGTISSSQLVARHQETHGDWLTHQFLPLDHPRFVNRFINHWAPDCIFFVESELWPNLILAARKTPAFIAMINARLSPTSHRRWQKMPKTFQTIVSCFDLILAQDNQTRDRVTSLGVEHVHMLGNLKRDMAPLKCNRNKYLKLQKIIGDRPCWLAASTHDDEESVIISTHRMLLKEYSDLLTIIVPRHPERTNEIVSGITEKVARASRDDMPDAKTSFYIGDTIGDMGLYYRLSPISFIGGSLIPHGGQNPLEAARLDNVIVHGPFTSNFTEIYNALSAHHGCIAVTRKTLFKTIKMLLSDDMKSVPYREGARTFIKSEAGATRRILKCLTTEIDRKIASSQRDQGHA